MRRETANAATVAEAAFKNPLREPCDIDTPQNLLLFCGENHSSEIEKRLNRFECSQYLRGQ